MVVLISQMFRLKGPDRVKFIESLTVADVAEMPENEIKLSVFTNEKGGIKVADTVVFFFFHHLHQQTVLSLSG